MNFRAHPSFATLVTTRNVVDIANVARQKACKDTQLTLTSAPAVGFPIKRPTDTGTKSIPIRTPTTAKEGQSVIAQVGEGATKAPETNPYRRQKTMTPLGMETLIQTKARMVASKVRGVRVLKAPILSAIKVGIMRPKKEPGFRMARR